MENTLTEPGQNMIFYVVCTNFDLKLSPSWYITGIAKPKVMHADNENQTTDRKIPQVSCFKLISLWVKCCHVSQMLSCAWRRLCVKIDMCPAHALSKHGGYNVTFFCKGSQFSAIDKQHQCRHSNKRTALGIFVVSSSKYQKDFLWFVLRYPAIHSAGV